MNKDNIIKVSIFIICSFLVSILVWLPIYIFNNSNTISLYRNVIGEY